MSVLEGAPFADYMKPPCTHDGLKPGTITVDKGKYPGDVGGKGAVCWWGDGYEWLKGEVMVGGKEVFFGGVFWVAVGTYDVVSVD